MNYESGIGWGSARRSSYLSRVEWQGDKQRVHWCLCWNSTQHQQGVRLTDLLRYWQ